MEKRVSNKIKYISFVLALSVVFIHTFNVEIYALNEYQSGLGKWLCKTENYLRSIQNVCVPYFFALAGYLFFRNYSWGKVWSKYASRAKSLLVPYLLWCTIYFLVYLLITNIPVISRYMNMDRVPLSFSYYLKCLWESTYTVLWFVKSLILSIICAPLYFLIMKKKKNKVLEVCSLAGSSVLLLYCLLKACGVIQFTIPILPLNLYFLLGAFLALRAKVLVEEKQYKIVGVMASIVLLVRQYFSGGGYDTSTLWILGFIVFSWYAVDIFKFKKNPPWWMEQTFFVYCAHSFILETCEKLWLIIGGKNAYAAMADYFLIPFIVLGMLLAVAWGMNKWCKPLYSVLTGGRGKR